MAIFPVDPLSVTPAWLSEVLGADVRECRLEQIGIGVGLLGRLYRAHLEGGPDVPTSVVVKFPMLDARIRSEICEDLEFYLREVRFYQEIGLANRCHLRVRTSPPSTRRHTTSSSCSRIWAGFASRTRPSGAPPQTPRPSSTASPATTPTGGRATASRRCRG
jgi:hypothetical protein